MRFLRMARKIERLRMQALRHEMSKRTDTTPEEAGVVFMYLLRSAAAGRRGEDVVERWRARGVSTRRSLREPFGSRGLPALEASPS